MVWLRSVWDIGISASFGCGNDVLPSCPQSSEVLRYAGWLGLLAIGLLQDSYVHHPFGLVSCNRNVG
jgi:hypothetical protein